ncbi:HPr kinase/phosphorylase [Rhodopseudomonas palustris]|uniref:Hpr(Ser) kinase/phosphatase n=1 Tax=Rhodopseudomonas palustris (strain BisB18) TaxID=316056 RepID=Q21BR6_RHOPB
MTEPAASSSGSGTVHASAVKVGDRAVLIRGPSGAGKSRLAFDLMLAGRAGMIPAAMLIGDDRVHLERRADGLVVRAAAAIAGLIEIRGLGLRRCDFVAEAVVGLVVDLAAGDAERLPQPAALRTTINGVELPRIPVGESYEPLPLVVAAFTTLEGSGLTTDEGDCSKRFDNHIIPTIVTK